MLTELANERGQGSVAFGIVVLAVAVTFIIILFVLRPDFEGIIDSVEQAIQGVGSAVQ